MKNLVAILSILVLVPAVALAAGAGQATGSAEPAATAASNQQILFTTAETLLSNGPIFCEPYPQYIDCDRWTNQYCTYQWNACRGCCEPSYTAPGANCPNICQ